MSPGQIPSGDGMSPLTKRLFDAASEARQHAYAPYSGYAVGAAMMDEHGAIFSGANIENASFPMGICAERAAIAKLANTGSRAILAVLVLSKDGAPPCGMCLQTIAEFAAPGREVPITLARPEGQATSHTLDELLPIRFGPSSVRTDGG